MIKINKALIIAVQSITMVALFIFGFVFESQSNEMNFNSNFLGMMAKIQTTNSLQNFFWCLSNNLSVLFLVFWINYWTFGIIGTLWCMNQSFLLGSIIKLSWLSKSFISCCFVFLEFISTLALITVSTYFRFDKSLKKYKQEKIILKVMGIIALILITAAILETIALNTI